MLEDDLGFSAGLAGVAGMHRITQNLSSPMQAQEVSHLSGSWASLIDVLCLSLLHMSTPFLGWNGWR